MLTGPIFRFELIAAGRRGWYFVVRTIYGVILLLALWTAHEQVRQTRFYAQGMSIQESSRIAEAIFLAFSWVQLLGVIAVTPALAIGTISTERERRTIEYLFATDLSNAEIVLGKIASRLLLVGKFILVGLPVLLLIRLLGGIPAGALVAAYVVTTSTALLLTALSTCVSVWSKRSRDATMRVFLVLIVLLLLPPALWGVWAFSGGGGWFSIGALLGWLTGLNPVWALGNALSQGGADLDMSEIWRVAAWHTVIAAALTALATSAVRRVHLGETAGAAAVAKALAAVKLPTLAWRPPVGERPMLWKEAFAGQARTRLGIVGSAAAAIIAVTMIGSSAYAFYYAVTTAEQGSWTPAQTYSGFLSAASPMLGTALLVMAAARAAGLVTTEKERDCWLSLLATPLEGRDIVQGKLGGNLYALKWGMLLLAGAWSLGVLLDPACLVAAAVFGANLTICALFVTALGLHFSLSSQTTLRATGATLGTSVFIGGGYLFCCCPLAVMGNPGPGGEALLVGLAPCMPFLLVCPALFYQQTHSHYDILEGELVIAYVAGTIGYAVAAMGLLANLTRDFDRRAGRCGARSDDAASLALAARTPAAEPTTH